MLSVKRDVRRQRGGDIIDVDVAAGVMAHARESIVRDGE